MPLTSAKKYVAKLRKAAVIEFPGSNCDHDVHHVLNDVAGIPAEYVWHRETSLAGYDAVVLPGGFAYGDYLRCGAIATKKAGSITRPRPSNGCAR